ncbi:MULTISPECIES: transcriptional regulator [unclassified Burkholderia]|uniref:transcriptional regulator n=1 Tax=unclassified Burkholderia TaxID=2613784 RepID=UPI0021AB5F5F|nr:MULTISPECIES: transcriptional regulator [unclassified Burkholderia]
MAANKLPPGITQQVFLRGAMTSLGMTRMEFAERISVPIKTLDKWLAPASTSDFRNMPDVVWAYVREVLDWTKKTT